MCQDAADIAGLNVLRLMHESTAIALSYGIYKSVRNLFHESEPQHVLFLDMGHSNYSASVVSRRPPPGLMNTTRPLRHHPQPPFHPPRLCLKVLISGVAFA